MGAMRWGMSMPAYKRYEHIFSKELPVVLPCSSPVSTAAYIRDVLRFAHTNNLKGGQWFEKVIVSPQDNGTVLIKPRPQFAVELGVKELPFFNLFDLVRKLQSGEIKEGFTCILEQDVSEVEDTILRISYTAGSKLCLRNLGGRRVEFIKFYGTPPEEEVEELDDDLERVSLDDCREAASKVPRGKAPIRSNVNSSFLDFMLEEEKKEKH